MIAASQCLVKTVDIAVISEEYTTVPARSIITGLAALVSSITITYIKFSTNNDYICEAQ